MGINYCLESALKMKSVSGIIVIIMKYPPLLLAKFFQMQESILAWLPNETLVTPMHTPVCVCTHTQWDIWRWGTKNHFHLGKHSSYF